MITLGLNDMFLGLGLSILIGGLIGAQREMRLQKEQITDFAGFRTFIFISMFGYLASYISINILENQLFLLISFVGMFLLIDVAYFAVTKSNPKDLLAISEVVGLLTFIIGVLISYGQYYFSITLAIIITSTLFLGSKLHSFAKHLKKYEIYAALKFGIISLIILPILPNKNYSLADLPIIQKIAENSQYLNLNYLAKIDVFNFYYLWLMVVFISGIGFLGYILIRTVGSDKGTAVTGFLGGLISSTAVTSSFSIESKRNLNMKIPLAIGVIVASSTMFFRILFEVIILNPSLFFPLLTSLGLMGVTGAIISIYLLKKSKKEGIVKKLELESPFTLGPALKFGLLYMFILFFSKLLTLSYGESGIYYISFFSGITDVDAITISLSTLALKGVISNFTAQTGIIIAATSNTIVKAGIAYYLGSRDFFKIILIGFSVILFVGGLSLLL